MNTPSPSGPPNSWLGCLLHRWTWQMAWRDSRSSRRRLLLFSTSIVLGIAALVAIASFGQNLEKALDLQAKSLLGADLVLSARHPLTPEEDQFLASLGGEQARETRFSSMVYFPRSNGTRLVQVRGSSGGFPFYGNLETSPPEAAAAYRQGNGALVEESLLLQYSAQIGDPIRIGELNTQIIGKLEKVPGETVAFATIAPRIFLSMEDLKRTKLVREGSVVHYRVYFKFPASVDVPRLVEKIRPRLDQYRLNPTTVAKRKEDLGRSMENLYHFLNLVGFIALLLGGVGVASAIHVHVKQKIPTVAVLRCLGCTLRQTFTIYLLQGLALGLVGSLAGAALGLVIQVILPRVLADFIPFTISFSIAWRPALQATLAGLVICLLFALLPLLSIRRISPLEAIRSTVMSQAERRRDPWVGVLYLLLMAAVTLFARSQTGNWRQAFGFAGGLAAAFGFLLAVARGLMWTERHLVSARLPFVWRQGLANLHRPNNRTLLLMLSLGLGTFLILTLYLVQNTLMTQLISSRQGTQPNMVLFDIQSDQKQAVTDLLRSFQLPILEEAPVVTMRLTSVKGRPVEKMLADPREEVPDWSLRREYRSTYRAGLRDAETLVAGTLVTNVSPSDPVIPVSLEEGIARELRVGLGDAMVFDVQGVPVSTRVTSLRKVDWRRVQPNFFVVFPPGSLEEAPAFHILVTRVNSPEQSAVLQRAVVEKFPNVSSIDLILILQTLDAILEKISFVIRFMALFTVLTGLVVLASTILTGRYQRLQESVLLRTLGASRRQVLTILAIEYACLGLLASLTGIVLALVGSFALATWVFKVGFAWTLTPLLVAAVAVSLLTVLTGLLANRGVCSHPPLEVLRQET